MRSRKGGTHKPMHSGAKGKGGDAKLKRAKMIAGEASNPKPRKNDKKEKYEPA